MGKLSGRKLLLIGDSGGIPASDMQACLDSCGAQTVFSATECFACSATGTMDLQNQQSIKDAAEKYGEENCVVVLGSSEAEGAKIYAETVSAGDPTYSGALAGVPLGLAVYHIFEDEIRSECDMEAWKDHVAMIEIFLETEALVAAVKETRAKYSKSTL